MSQIPSRFDVALTTTTSTFPTAAEMRASMQPVNIDAQLSIILGKMNEALVQGKTSVEVPIVSGLTVHVLAFLNGRGYRARCTQTGAAEWSWIIEW